MPIFSPICPSPCDSAARFKMSPVAIAACWIPVTDARTSLSETTLPHSLHRVLSCRPSAFVTVVDARRDAIAYYEVISQSLAPGRPALVRRSS
jgi:hypothetical protein